MLHYIMVGLMASVVNARYQDIGRPMKTFPGSSLVNLGKIDVSFYINTRAQDLPAKPEARGSSLSSSIDGPCPCSSLKLLKDTPLKSPSEILGKILSGNDMFSYKEPTSSLLCCDSHESVREDILLEFSPRQNHIVENSQNSFSLLPFIFDNIPRPKLPKVPAKNSAVEIFFYPKKEGILPVDFEKVMGYTNVIKKKGSVKKDAIQIVGDKEIRNDFKSDKFIPHLPTTVRKDLTNQYSTQGLKEDITTINKSNNI